MPRLVIVGQKWLGEQTLRLCLRRGDAVLGVFAPGPEDRLWIAAARAGIPVENCRRRLTGERMPPGADLILCAHAHAYISRGARERTRLGALGYHPSLLPRHRGRDAVEQTILSGDAVAGGTVYWLDDGWDTGAPIVQARCPVRPGDDAATLWRRDLAPMGVHLIGQVLAGLEFAEGVS